jgi:hypothetical protein
MTETDEAMVQMNTTALDRTGIDDWFRGNDGLKMGISGRLGTCPAGKRMDVARRIPGDVLEGVRVVSGTGGEVVERGFKLAESIGGIRDGEQRIGGKRKTAPVGKEHLRL